MCESPIEATEAGGRDFISVEKLIHRGSHEPRYCNCPVGTAADVQGHYYLCQVSIRVLPTFHVTDHIIRG